MHVPGGLLGSLRKSEFAVPAKSLHGISGKIAWLVSD